eukprot:PITA_24028
MKLASWNCRGLGNASKAEAVMDLLKIEPSDILMLQETKIKGRAHLDISKSKWKKSAGKVVSSRGSYGGLATLWKKDLFLLKKSHETQHWIYTELTHCASKLTISLFNLYVLVTYSEKRECYTSLSAFLEQHNPSNIIIAGDLNIVLKSKEKRGVSNSRDPMLAFVEELSQRWDLLDFNLIRGLYTWSNDRSRIDHISARLDRFLVQDSLMMDKKIIILPQLTSDHKPIQLLLEDEEDIGPLPFRFIPLWIEREGFIDTVKEAWATSFSRSLWLKAGDRNTSFFHRQYRARQSRNHISEIKTTKGHVSKGFTQVKAVVDSHFRNLFSEGTQASKGEIAEFLSNIPRLIRREDNAALTSEVTEEEIIKVI